VGQRPTYRLLLTDGLRGRSSRGGGGPQTSGSFEGEAEGNEITQSDGEVSNEKHTDETVQGGGLSKRATHSQALPFA
jgi:hypothetical protein